jgi:putative inorganic carbon (HCO3(-)) transporter
MNAIYHPSETPRPRTIRVGGQSELFGSSNSILPGIPADQPVRRFLRGLFILGMIAGYLVVVSICPKPAPLSWIGLLACLYLGLCVVDPDSALGILMVYLPLQFEVIQGIRWVVTDMLVVVLIGVVWLRTGLEGRMFRFGFGTGWLLLWMAVLLVSSATSLNPTVSVNMWIRAAKGVVVFLIVCDQIQTRLQLDRLLLWLIFSGLFLAYYGLAESVMRFALMPWEVGGQFNNWIRVTTFVTQSNETAWYLVPILSVAMAAIRMAGNRRGRFLWGVVAVAILGCILLTFSRGGWIGLGVVGIAAPFAKKFKIAMLAGLAVLMLVAAPLRTNLMARSASVERKIVRYLLTPDLAAHHPVWGYGLGMYKSIGKYYPDLMPKDYTGKYSHSLYITLIVETGVISAILFVGLLGTIGLRLLRTVRQLKIRSPMDSVLAQSLLAAFLAVVVLELGYSNLPVLMFWVLLALFHIAPSVWVSKPAEGLCA